MTLATLALLHGGDERLNLAYFWSSILIVLLPVATFVVLAVLVIRAYRRRREADGGGDPGRT
ncbi:MAG: hypothetical protein ACREL9_10625 [Gemmatimonadales bacterium]